VPLKGLLGHFSFWLQFSCAVAHSSCVWTHFQVPCCEQDTDADTVDATAVTRLLHMDIDNVLHTLSPRECGVLRMRYGLDDGQEKTLEEVGARFKVRPLQNPKNFRSYSSLFIAHRGLTACLGCLSSDVSAH
jgi:Sigma-70, region 4